MPFTLGEIAVRFGCVVRGDPQLSVGRVATLQHATADALSFLANPKYRRFLAHTRAGAVVLEPRHADACPVSALVSKNPYALYARIAGLLHPPQIHAAGVHATAVVDSEAKVDPSASIGPHAVVEAAASIGPRVVIGPGCLVMRGAHIGADTRLVAKVTVCHDVKIGERCLLHPGVVIGSDGFGNAPEDGAWIKVPQVGSVSLGNDVEIGSNTTVDRGAIDDTVIGDGVRLDNLIQVGHNVRIGAHTAVAACTGIAGSTTIGKRCMIAGMVGIAGQLSICDDVVVTGMSMVSASIRKPGMYSSGSPVQETAKFRRNLVRFRHLDELAKQVEQLGTGQDEDS
jgi:UDP-3-O-[3-hydroxymyristoyl] glucosamine N-acyltransferase